MANHKSAKKRNRQNIKRNAANRPARATLRTQIKKARAEIQAGGADAKKGEVALAVRALARAGQNGLLHRRAADRRISRLAQAAAKS